MGRRGGVRNGISFSRAEVRKVDSPSDDLLVSPGSLQVECRGLEDGEEEEDAGAELVEWLDTCEEEELVDKDEEEVRMESRPLDSSSVDGIHSHVSRSENLEQLSISRTLSSPTPGMSSFSSAVWKMHEVLESLDDSKMQELSEPADIFSHIVFESFFFCRN